MTVSVLSAPPHNCANDGHMIALRLRYDPGSPSVWVTPFCEVCRSVMLPHATFDGPQADWLMSLVAKAERAPDASPEAYDRMFE